ncbi:hypothetical protein GCM10009743_42070 [Kribbella swartbergensis]
MPRRNRRQRTEPMSPARIFRLYADLRRTRHTANPGTATSDDQDRGQATGHRRQPSAQNGAQRLPDKVHR